VIRRAAVLALGLGLAFVSAGPGLARQAAPHLAFTPQDVDFGSSFSGVSFTDGQHGHSVGAYHSIFGTVDAGLTWVREQNPLPTREPTRGEDVPLDARNQSFAAVSFVDADHGHAVSDDDGVVATSDGGRTWVLQATPRPSTVGAIWPQNFAPSGWGFGGVSFTDPDHGYVVGHDGLILATIDGGATWSYQGDPRYGILAGVSFADQYHGQVVGRVTGRPDQVSYTTLSTDDGEKWQPLTAVKQGDPVSPVNLTAVAVSGPLHALAVGNNGRIFVTFDEGKTWRNRRNGTNEDLLAVAFADDRRALAVGSVNFQGDLRAQVLATADGGQTWTAYPSPQFADLEGVDFADPSTAYAVGCKTITTGVGCVQAGIVKIDFPELDLDVEQPAASGRSVLPFVLVGGALVVAAAGILVARRL
jgi:photosystem II stability/assembly factor-like uncharacterized protein